MQEFSFSNEIPLTILNFSLSFFSLHNATYFLFGSKSYQVTSKEIGLVLVMHQMVRRYGGDSNRGELSLSKLLLIGNGNTIQSQPHNEQVFTSENWITAFVSLSNNIKSFFYFLKKSTK